MIDIAVIRQKILLNGKYTPPPDEKNSDETCPVAQPTVETGPSLTEQIKLAKTWQGEAGRAIVANLEKLKMLEEVSEEMKRCP